MTNNMLMILLYVVAACGIGCTIMAFIMGRWSGLDMSTASAREAYNNGYADAEDVHSMLEFAELQRPDGPLRVEMTALPDLDMTHALGDMHAWGSWPK
jgi:hypothetical protein